jgi:hypothetical protein
MRRDRGAHGSHESGRLDTQADGILLDPEGNYVMLDVVAYPDTRPYLFEIFLGRETAGMAPSIQDDTPCHESSSATRFSGIANIPRWSICCGRDCETPVRKR